MSSRHRRRAWVTTAVVTALLATSVTAWGAAQDTAGCRASYQVGAQWPGGFLGRLSVTNQGAALRGWTVGLTFPEAGQRVVQGWNATWTQSGRTAVAASMTWNAALDPGAVAGIGFVGVFSGSNPTAVTVTLNGVTCSGTGGSPAASPVPTPSSAAPVPAPGATTPATPTGPAPVPTVSAPEPTAPAGEPGPAPAPTVRNTVSNPVVAHGPDPWLQYYDGYYYLATTTWNSSVTMRRSRTLGGLATAPQTEVFRLTRPNGAGTMWAPEFHLLDGPDGKRWYLYYTAGRQPYDLGTQRIHVLESAGTDPMGPYSFKADLLDPVADNAWELDASILRLNGKLYLLGTYIAGTQNLFIRPLGNPWTASGGRVNLYTPTAGWETVGGAVAEAPEVLQHNGKTFIVYSASHCSTPDYKLGMLTLTGNDPLNPRAWTRAPEPVFQRSDAGGVFGPGHNGFFTSPDGTENWIVYHANDSARGGCDMNRSTRVQRFTWNPDGTPNFGTPARAGVKLTAPSGEPAG